MNVITRFCPSPTGYLHVGNARTAIINYLFALKTGGKFILRFDDTDIQRSKQEYADSILEDLSWLSIKWDILERQSDRLARYDEIKTKLIDEGRLYPCYESEEELEIKRKLLLGKGLPPIYDRSALNLTKEQKDSYEKAGIKPYYRFLLLDKETAWDDIIKGHISYQGKDLTDPVVVRANGSPTYTFCSIIDDIDFAATHIIRGEDHVTNTAVQIQMFESLTDNIPQFAHLALIQSKEAKISKRIGGFDIRSLREDGIEPLTILNLFAKIGTSYGHNDIDSIKTLSDKFDFSKISKGAVNFDREELFRLNQKLIGSYKASDVATYLKEMGIDEEFFEKTKANLMTIKDIKEWWLICKEKVQPIIEEDDTQFLESIINLLPSGDLDKNSFNVWLTAIKGAFPARKGKSLFMPIRLAITGLEHGPELQNLLPLIGRDKIIGRLNRVTC